MKIVFTGGGTLGSVTPLLALIPSLQEKKHELYFIGTQTGPERALVEKAGVPFYSIRAPKLRRYVTWRHLLIPAEFILGILQSFSLLMMWQPKVIVSAGSFVSVPVVLAGARMGIPCIIHQQDLKPGMAIRIMKKYARKVTVVFEESLKDFPASKTTWIGNPVRDLTPTTDTIELDKKYPTVLIFGGGTGAAALNALVSEKLCEGANIIHVTGKGKETPPMQHRRYHRSAFLAEEMKEALQKADVVVARAGLGTISELSALGKPSIIIPMPGTHQDDNAAFLKRHEAAVVLDQRTQTPQTFTKAVHAVVEDKQQQQSLSQAIQKLTKPNATQALVEIIESVVGSKA